MHDDESMILDEQLPVYDVAITEHLVVDADPVTVWRAAREVDCLEVYVRLLEVAQWVRQLPARLLRRPHPDRMSLAAAAELPGWLRLGERKGSEIAFGAIGTFWRPTVEWRMVPREQFGAFAEPGCEKIVGSLSMRPYGPDRTLLSYEFRAAATDLAAHRAFARYWWLVRPYLRHAMRHTLEQIGTDATYGGPFGTVQPVPVGVRWT